MTIAMTFPAGAALQAIAARAFKPDVTLRGQVPDLDTRPLLPAYEAEIGRMMELSVPHQLRPAANAHIGVNSGVALRAERMEIARRMVAEGATVNAIAAVMGTSWTTAQDYALAVGLPLSNGGKAPQPAPRRAEAARMHQEGYTIGQIAEAMGTRRKSIRRHLRDAGVL